LTYVLGEAAPGRRRWRAAGRTSATVATARTIISLQPIATGVSRRPASC